MNVKIRWKLLILMLAIALTPALVLRVTGQRAMRSMGQELSSTARTTLIDLSGKGMLRLVDDHALTLKREFDLLEIALERQAHTAEMLLADTASDPLDYYPIGGGHMAAPPAGSVLSGSHFMERGPQAGAPIAVSYGMVGIRPPPEDGTTSNYRALASLSPLHEELNDRIPGLILWQFTVLEDGAFAVYPAHGRLPMMYDPRRQQWYKQTLEAGVVHWSSPLRDAVTGEPVVIVASPVLSAAGSVSGVTGIAVRLSGLLHQNPHHLPYQGMLIRLVRPEVEIDGSLRLRVVAADIGRSEARYPRWSIPEAGQRFELGGDGFQKMAVDVASGRNNIRWLEEAGERRLFAYAEVLRDGTALVVSIPEQEIVASAMRAGDSVRMRIEQHTWWTGMTLSVVLLLVVLLVFFLSRKISGTLESLADTVRKVAGGDFTARAPVTRNDELGELAGTFNELVPALEDQVRMKDALDLACGVQESLLPQGGIDGACVEIAGRSDYCDETGGDYYDYLEDFGSKGWLGVVVGDVSGHGVHAALLMASARAFLRARATWPGTLGEIITDVNRLVTSDTFGTGHFITAFFLTVEAGGNGFSWVRAGHDPAILYNPERDEFSELEGEGLPLGVTTEISYKEECRVGLEAGEIVFIGTDGIWETRNAAGEMFGKDRLRAVVRKNAGRDARSIRDALAEELAAFRAQANQDDDATFVVIKGKQSCALPGEEGDRQ